MRHIDEAQGQLLLQRCFSLFLFVEIYMDELCVISGEPFSRYVARAFEVSTIAPAMKTIYEAIKTSSMAYVTINNLPLELQLPPYLDTLLHSQSDQETEFCDSSDDEYNLNWGLHMTLGWKLPSIAPWKTLLLLDIDNDMDPHMILRGPHENAEDRTFAEGLVRFLEIASVTLSYADLLSILHSLTNDVDFLKWPIYLIGIWNLKFIQSSGGLCCTAELRLWMLYIQD